MVHCTPIFGSFMFFLKWLLQIIKHWSSERTDRLTTRVFFGGVTLLNLSQQLGFFGCFLPLVGWGGWRDEGRQITSYCLHSSNVLLRCYAAVSLVMELRPRSGRYALKFVIWLRPRSRCYVLNLVMPRRPRSWTYALNLKRLAGVGGNHKEPPKSCKDHWKTTWCDKQFYKVMLKMTSNSIKSCSKPVFWKKQTNANIKKAARSLHGRLLPRLKKEKLNNGLG